MNIMSRHCPGMEPANWRIEDVFEVPCPACGAERPADLRPGGEQGRDDGLHLLVALIAILAALEGALSG